MRDGQALRYTNFKQVRLPLIPYDEQQSIADYISKNDKKTTHAITLQTRQIERLREYRRVLIDGAVTGQFRVGEQTTD